MLALAIAPDNKYIISGSYDNTCKIWNSKVGKEIKTFCGHSKPISSLTLTADNKYIISGSYDKTIKMWNFETDEEAYKLIGH